MRVLLTLIAFAVAGTRIWMQYQNQQVLQTQLDEARKNLEDAQRQLAVYQQQQQNRPQPGSISQWKNPLDAPAYHRR